MPYGGAYHDQYASFPAAGHGQQPSPQYYPNGMQYAVQQQPVQPMSQQPYPTPMNGDDYPKHYYQPQQQRAYAAPQPVQYTHQYPGYQQPVPYSAPLREQSHAQTPQAPPAYQRPSVLHQQPPVQQQPPPFQYSQLQQQQHHVPVPPQWPNQPVSLTSPLRATYPVANSDREYIEQASASPAVHFAPENVSTGRYPSSEAGARQYTTAQVPRQASLAASPMYLHHSASSSPDPLAPSPNPRQARPQQAINANISQQQPRLSHQPVASKPKINVTPSAHTLETPQQRIASHVEIPIMSQPTKRRRSNEGIPVPVCEGPSVDYQAVLLALSDEYIAAAYSLQSLDTDEQLQEYHKLIATGIACLESVLKNYRHPDARREARIRLRLAALLVEETENDMEAEETLSKGIALCERSRLTDLKYAMHHLLARLMYKNSPKAALKAADKLVQEVETLRLLHWTYAFRLLRVCFGMQLPGHSETAATLKHLTTMSSAAENHHHIPMQITTATLEAMVHLRSGTVDAVNLAQRAMASARTHQLAAEIESMPQVWALLDCLDLSCSLLTFDPKYTAKKMTQMHASMDPATRQSGWSKNGSFFIPMLPSSNSELKFDTLGIMKTMTDGTAILNLRWMTQSGIYVVGYLLSGITYLHKDEEGKAQSFLREASLVKATDLSIPPPNQLNLQGLKLNNRSGQFQQQPRSLSDRCKAEDQQSALGTEARLLLIFEYCGRFNWKLARTSIDQTRHQFVNRGIELSDQAKRTLLYLDAMCKQAQGDLQGALSIYQSPDLSFDANAKLENVEKDFRVLSALSSIMILRTLGSADIAKANELHSAVEPYCLDHSNRAFCAAYFTTKATANDSRTMIIKTKQHLSSAVQAAKAAANDQILFVVMNAMTDLFFQSIIGEQAEKSAQAARTLAKRSGDKLWLCVADNMYGEIKERCGKNAEAAAAYKEAIDALKAAPEGVRRRLMGEAHDGRAWPGA